MAVKVHVQNFQSIADAEITVDGLTVITGANNSGKSALLRAIRGVFQNTRGDKFVRNGTKHCTVKLDFGDGQTIVWQKGPKFSPRYTINGGDPIKPGQGVPDEVRAFGVVPVVAGGREVWPQVAPQFSGQIFLLDEPGSVLAEAVANVDRVGRLNRALKSVESDRRSSASELKVRRSDEKKHQAHLNQFEGLGDVVEETEAIEQAAHLAGRMARALKGLVTLQDRLQRAQSTVTALQGVEDLVVPQGSDAQELLEELRPLERLQDRLGASQGQVKQLDGIDKIEVDVDSVRADKCLAALKNLRKRRSRLEGARSKVGERGESLTDLEKDLVGSEAEAQEILGGLGECPTCGMVVGGDHVHEVRG